MIVSYLLHYRLVARGIYVAGQGWLTDADLPDTLRDFALLSLEESFPAIVTRQMGANTADFEANPEVEALHRQNLHPFEITSAHFDQESGQLVDISVLTDVF